MNKLTPNLIVQSIEECLPFWVDRLGFEKTVEVPHGDQIGFVILKRDGIELMLQSQSSFEADVPEVPASPQRAVLYIDVADLGHVRQSLEGYPNIVTERTTAYGADELILRDPGGHVVFFAARSAKS